MVKGTERIATPLDPSFVPLVLAQHRIAVGTAEYVAATSSVTRNGSQAAVGANGEVIQGSFTQVMQNKTADDRVVVRYMTAAKQ